jgi:DNA repair exonuclease SbcCD ATPase subunit
MANIETKIRDASQRNNELLGILRETDSAVPDLQNHDRYINDLERQIQLNQKKLADLKKKHTKELKDHEKYRDSVMRRFAFKMTGKREKFEERAAKEEREYFDVLQQEHQATQTQKNLEAALGDAQRARPELSAATDRHNSAQKQLDNLYEGIFGGQTPGFPDEDAREQDNRAALDVYRTACSAVEAQLRACRLLEEGEFKARAAVGAMDEALRASVHDMMGGGTFADVRTCTPLP